MKIPRKRSVPQFIRKKQRLYYFQFVLESPLARLRIFTLSLLLTIPITNYNNCHTAAWLIHSSTTKSGNSDDGNEASGPFQRHRKPHELKRHDWVERLRASMGMEEEDEIDDADIVEGVVQKHQVGKVGNEVSF